MAYERTYSTFMNYNRTHPGSTASGDYDIALITLDRTLGDRTGWMSFGYDNNNADFAPGAILNTAGYPASGGYDGRHMEFSYGPIAGLSLDGLAINYRQSAITTFGGQSGSPVWRYTPATGASVVYGVHVGGNGTPGGMNFATRITQSIFADLQAWRAADRTPAYTVAASAPAMAAQTLIVGMPTWSSFSGNAQAVTAVPLATNTSLAGGLRPEPRGDDAPNPTRETLTGRRQITLGVLVQNTGKSNDQDDELGQMPWVHTLALGWQKHGVRIHRGGIEPTSV